MNYVCDYVKVGHGTGACEAFRFIPVCCAFVVVHSLAGVIGTSQVSGGHAGGYLSPASLLSVPSTVSEVGKHTCSFTHLIVRD